MDGATNGRSDVVWQIKHLQIIEVKADHNEVITLSPENVLRLVASTRPLAVDETSISRPAV